MTEPQTHETPVELTTKPPVESTAETPVELTTKPPVDTDSMEATFAQMSDEEVEAFGAPFVNMTALDEYLAEFYGEVEPETPAKPTLAEMNAATRRIKR